LIGKPEAPFFHQAMRRLGVAPDETVMIGDRYDTDILGGHNAGIRTAAVLTGVTAAAEFAAANPAPTWVFDDLHALLGAWNVTSNT
jgi:4-nitrophenyl phosphatase